MSVFREINEKIGWSNIISVMSFVIAITCVAYIARIAREYSELSMQLSEPIVINSNKNTKVAINQNLQNNSSSYNNMLKL